jgi:hypothetical protein
VPGLIKLTVSSCVRAISAVGGCAGVRFLPPHFRSSTPSSCRLERQIKEEYAKVPKPNYPALGDDNPHITVAAGQQKQAAS